MPTVSAFWGDHQVSREEAAVVVSRMLAALAAIDPLISTWRSKGRSRKQATASPPIEDTADALTSRLRVQRTDSGSDELPQLGFSLDAWNGAADHEDQAAFSVTIGLHAGNPALRNSFVVDLPAAWGRGDQRLGDVTTALCTHLKPDEVALVDNGRREVIWSHP